MDRPGGDQQAGARHDEPAAGRQHAPQLGQRRRPVLQVVQHQRGDDIVERAVGERQRAAQIGHLQGRVGAEPPPGQLQHLGAGVDAIARRDVR